MGRPNTLRLILAQGLLGGVALCLVPTAQGWKSCEQVRLEAERRDETGCGGMVDDSYLEIPASLRRRVELDAAASLDRAISALDAAIAGRYRQVRIPEMTAEPVGE